MAGLVEEAGRASYEAYWRELNHYGGSSYIRTGVVTTAVVNVLFVFSDFYLFPAQFADFFLVRCALQVGLIGLFFAPSSGVPAPVSKWALTLSTEAMLGMVIFGTGEPSGGYYVGLILFLAGVPVLLPFSVREAAVLSVCTFGLYACSPLVLPWEIPWREFLMSSVFLFSAGIVCIASAALIDNSRFRDFVRRREVEKARDTLRELDQQKSRFTANVHHELRTPLTLTLAPLESLLGGEFGEVNPLQRDYLRTMHVNALRLLKLINNLLDLAKIESDQLRIERRLVSPAQLAADIVSGAQPLARKKGVNLSVGEFDESLSINADPDALEKVLINLVGNSLKFTDSGGSISVCARADGDGIRLEVSDTGIGLEPRDCERIFDRFAQADGSSTRRHEGTGIGLALSKELVELHGGKIWAVSKGIGFGTNVAVTLPQGEEDVAREDVLADAPRERSQVSGFADLDAQLSRDHEEASKLLDLERSVDRWERTKGSAHDEGAQAGQGGADMPDVLVCEDNPDMRRLLVHVLSSEFAVRTAKNGREGLEEVRRRMPDLVLTDVMMPEMSGTELCETLKCDSTTEALPVILVTSKAEREMKIEGLELGADDYVTKPFHSRELLARVRSLVRLRQLQTELAERNRALEHANDELETTLDELKEAEAQLVQSERLAAVGELAAGVAHEVNNPVNYSVNAVRAMKPYIEDLVSAAREVCGLVQESGPPLSGEEKAKISERLRLAELSDTSSAVIELAGIVEEGLERTGKLVGDLRDFSRPALGEKVHFSVVQSVDSVSRFLRHSMAEKNVSVAVSCAEGVPLVVGDPQAIGQVLLNILKNASEALEEGGGGKISVSIEAHASGVQVAIRDNGPGIEPDDIARLFDPFFSTKGAGKGTGLGLSISRQVIESHGGTIGVSSVLGDGACFEIWLPEENIDAA